MAEGALVGLKLFLFRRHRIPVQVKEFSPKQPHALSAVLVREDCVILSADVGHHFHHHIIPCGGGLKGDRQGLLQRFSS